MGKKRNYKALKVHFLQKDIQQRDVAVFLGISESTMSQIMGGYGRPFTIVEAVKMIKRYGGTVEMFTGEEK